MSLTKRITDAASGVVTNYHRIRSVVIVRELSGGTKVDVHLESFVSADVRRNEGAQPASPGSYFSFSDPIDGEPVAWSYAQIKARDEWSDATDA